MTETRIARGIGRTLLLGAAAMLLSADDCDSKKRGETQINGNVHVSGSDDGNVRVRVLGRDETDETDSGGDFSLKDRVSGPLTLLFDRSDGISADLDVPPFPRGSVVNLDDIDLDFFDSRADYDVASLSFSGRVTEVDCANARIFVEGKVEPRDGDFPILTTDARISNRNNDVVNCSAVQVGDEVDVRGRLETSGLITRSSVGDRSW